MTIGEQEQPLGVLVQPPPMETAPAAADAGAAGPAPSAPGVLGGGAPPGGLVEHHINPLLRGNGPAIHCDGGVPSATLSSGPLGRAPYLDPACLDQRLGLFPGPLARGRQQLVQPLHGLSLLYPLFSPLYHIFSAVDIE